MAEGLDHHVAFWREFDIRCLRSRGIEFQRFFEDIMTRSRPGFMRVRAYGSVGDWKCDGLFRSDGVFYQVYSPDEIRVKPLVAKIESDLAGAVMAWGDELKEWHFVYNVKNGVAPQVPAVLTRLAAKYPAISLREMSNDALWDVARALPAERLAEVLGMPVAPPSLARAPSGRTRTMILHEAMMPIDIIKAADAMLPDEPLGAPVKLWPLDEEQQSWELASLFQERLMRKLRELGQTRLAAFSFAPIPLSVHLGYVMSDRLDAHLFQYHRDSNRLDWIWREDAEGDSTMSVTGVPAETIREPIEVVLRLSLSHEVLRHETLDAVGDGRRVLEIDLTVPKPSVLWLQRQEQLRALDHQFREIMQAIDRLVPACPLLHLFYAGPVPGAIRLGQAINPRTAPPIALYQYDRRQTPRHNRVLTLGERGAANPFD